MALPPHVTPLTDLDEARRVAAAGERLEALRAAGRRLHDRLRAGPKCLSVRTFDIGTFPYPTRYALSGAASIPAPFVMMTNRCQLVVFETADGPKRLLVNPSDAEANLETPYFQWIVEKLGVLASRRFLARLMRQIPEFLDNSGIAPEQIDYVTYDHLHTQDLRRVLGRWAPRARLLAFRAELDIYRRLHPLQRYWYIPSALDGIAPERILPLDRDVLLGDGVALVATPGHTLGNHTIVLHTDRGLWTISENGVACDAYSPSHSRIAGVARHAAAEKLEVILNGNTREASLDQYNSMILELALADPVADAPEFVQHFPSSELTASFLAPGLGPTYSHGAIAHGPTPAAARSFSRASATAPASPAEKL
jgi:glyoxylase-like metal-dependent hydrolase (beta-lactamase superfamily II)